MKSPLKPQTIKNVLLVISPAENSMDHTDLSEREAHQISEGSPQCVVWENYYHSTSRRCDTAKTLLMNKTGGRLNG